MTAHLQASEQADVATVHFGVAYPDTLDPDLLTDELTDLVRRLPETTVLIDLSGVVILTSSHLGMLLNVRKELEQAGRKLVLGRLSPHVHDLMHATRLDGVFQIEPPGA